jgi:selenium metabolism protein YedF
MRIIDTKGKQCPVPIIETRKALRENKAGEAIQVLTDNKTAFSNISRYLADNKIKFNIVEENGVWTFTITNDNGFSDSTRAEDYCEVPVADLKSGDYAVVISSQYMGQGDDELGLKLMKSFFVALSCLDSMPSSIMFYNSGVKITVNGSPVIDILRELENKGVEMLICGACVDHFKLHSLITVGKISDMYIITDKLSRTGNIIRP